VIATTSADLSAIEQMAADLGHAGKMGHRMGTPVRSPAPHGWRARYSSGCEACWAVLIVYIGEPPAHQWCGCDLPCRGGG